MRIPTIDDQVVFREVWNKSRYHRVDDRASGNEQHYVSGGLKLSEKLRLFIANVDRHSPAFVHQKGPFICVEIKTDARDPVLGDVKQKIASHRAEADHSKMCFCHPSVPDVSRRPSSASARSAYEVMS